MENPNTIKVVIPEDVEVEIISGTTDEGDEIYTKVTMTFEKHFIRRTVFNPNETRWGSSSEWLFAGMEIRGAFLGKKPGDVVELTRDQHEKLKSVLEKPQNPYNHAVMYQLRPFMIAILDAKEKIGAGPAANTGGANSKKKPQLGA